jgi:hypothetical protein
VCRDLQLQFGGLARTSLSTWRNYSGCVPEKYRNNASWTSNVVGKPDKGATPKQLRLGQKNTLKIDF